MTMMKLYLFGIAATVLLAQSGFGSLGAQASESSSINALKPSWEGFTLSIQMAQPKEQDQESVGASEPIGIHIIFKNVSTQERILPLAREVNRSSIVLENEKGEKIPLTRYGQKNAGRPFTFGEVTPKHLKPGEVYRYSFVLNRLFDMTESGTYFLTIKYKAPLYFGPQQSLPKGLIPEPRTDEPEPRIRRFEPPAINDMPNPLYERERNRTILVPAPEDAPNVPEIASNTVTIKVRPLPAGWIYRGETQQVR